MKIALLAAAGTLAIASAASAQDQGYYGALGFGLTADNDANDFQDTGFAYPASFDSNYDLDPSINIYGSFGQYLARGLRAEIELATRTQDVDELPGDGLGFAGFGSDGNMGDITVNTVMFNLYKDFNNTSAMTPYIGAGIGAAFIRPDVDNSTYTSATNTPSSPYLIVMADRETALAAQAMAGVAFDLTDSIDLDVRYRYLLTDRYNHGAYINGPLAGVESQYTAQELTAGLRWNFGAPAPAAAPAVAPVVTFKDCWDGSRVVASTACPPQPIEETVEAPEDLSLVVYFDFDKSNLSPAAQNLISARSAEALEYDVQGVIVQGNTDTSGSASYNNALSARRASVVRDALISNGIAGSLIDTQALGESNPAKPTADGVREPLNRRTEVQFEF